MNPLQEHAHVFANGKFQVKVAQTAKYAMTADIMTYHHRMNAFDLWREGDMGWEYFCDISRCTLIARPISDMTEDEIDQTEAFKDFEEYINTDNLENSFDYVREAEDGRIFNAHDTAHLLSIGVYPFSQSHFGKTVIDSRTL